MADPKAAKAANKNKKIRVSAENEDCVQLPGRKRALALSDALLAEHTKRSRDAQSVDKYVPSEKLSIEELRRRAENASVPEMYRAYREDHTPENRLLSSFLRYRDFSYPYRRAYDAMVSNVMRQQFAEISFIVQGVQYDFIGVQFQLPTLRGAPLYPSDALMLKDSSYSAIVFPTLRLSDERGRTRDIRLNLGKFPVMVRSVLCNLHPANAVGLHDRPTPDARLVDLPPLLSATSNVGMSDPTLRFKYDEFLREHNESTTDQLARFIVCGNEITGNAMDKQRTSTRQIISPQGRKPHVRYIATGPRTSNLILFYNDKMAKATERKRGAEISTLQIHVSDFQRNNMDDNHINLFVPFFVCGWDYERVLLELKRFVPDDEHIWQQVRLEMAVAYQDFCAIRAFYEDDPTLYTYLRMEMRDKGRNQRTGRAFTQEQVHRLLLETMFRHMNVDYPAQGWGTPAHIEVNERKLRLLLVMVADLQLHILGVTPPIVLDRSSRKKHVTLSHNIQNLFMRYLLEVRRYWSKWARQQPIQDIMELDAEAYVEQVLTRFDMTKTFERSLTGKPWGVFLTGINSKPSVLPCHEKIRRSSLYDAIAQCHRTSKPINPQVKESKSRDHDGLSEGVICGLDTPNGQHVGLTEYKTVVADISISVSDTPILEWIKHNNVTRSRPDEEFNTVLTVNGRFYNWCKPELGHTLRVFKRHGVIDRYTAIVPITEPRRELEIFTDEGRLMLPALVVCEETGQVLADKLMPGETDFMKLLEAGCIEYLDKREHQYMHFAFDRHDCVKRTKSILAEIEASDERVRRAREQLDPLSWKSAATLRQSEQQHLQLRRYARVQYIHIDPSAQLGLAAGLAPGLNKNYAVRAGFAAQMLKHAIGMYHTNPMARADTCVRMPMYGTLSGYHTVVGDAVGPEAYHTSQVNVLVAADESTPDDSLKINRQCVDAGHMSFATFKRKEVEEEPGILFGIAPGRRSFRRKYRNITDSGLPRQGAVIREDEVLVARTAHGTRADDVHLGHGECGTVDRVFIVRDGFSELRRVIIVLRHFRGATVGDKYTNAQGQKATVGRICPPEDMPTIVGQPDELIQQISHPIPYAGRVTIASMDEIKYTRVFGYTSHTMNATPFARFKPEHLEREIAEYGSRPNGMMHIMLSDGTISQRRAYVGTMSYAVLPHFADEKIHFRGFDGPREATTDQPQQGKARSGGLRFSSMEIEMLANEGCSAEIRERLMLAADVGLFIYCRNCKLRYDAMFFRGARCRQCLNQEFFRAEHPTSLIYLENLLVLAAVDLRLHFYFPDKITSS